MKPQSYDAINDALMLSTQDIAKMLQCSDRHVTNLRKDGRIPPPVKLGELVRWPRRVIDEWIEAGCPVAAASSPRDDKEQTM